MLKNLRTVFLFAMLLAVNCAFVYGQPSSDRVVTGTVIDEDGGALPGASVMVKGTKIGATTDVNGKFNIDVPADAKTLVFKFIGMADQEASIGNKKVINISLKSTTSNLNEVVVVGYGTSKKVNLTTSQVGVSAKELNRTVNTTIEQAIQGRAAGVYVTQNSGQPGGGMSINIRGVSTITGSTEPLYVIDGVQIQVAQISFGAQSSSNPLAGLNPSDVEDVQVLQGPSATAIYGSRGTNGVVMITTKRGKSGDVKIAYNYQHNIQTPPKNLPVMNLQQYAQMVNEYHAIAGGETPQQFLDPTLLGEGTDWQKELFKNAPMGKHSLSLSGGGEKSLYYISGDYLNQSGVAAGSGFKRGSFRLNLDNKPKEWLTLGTNLSVNQTNSILTSSQENVIANSLQLTPQVPVKNIDGSWGGGDLNNGANKFAPVNPIAIANLTTNTNTVRELNGGLNVAAKLFKGLSFRSSFNTNVNFSNSKYYVPTYKIGWAENVTAAFSNGSSQSTYWNFNQQLEYNRQLGKHSLSAMATHESQESSWRYLEGRRTGFLTNDILDLAAGDKLTATNNGGSSPFAMDSYLGRINYNYGDRYIVSGTFRADGSANFGSDNKWGYFPSISAAWRISQEKFFKVPFISELKLRLETGTTGNQGNFGPIFSPLVADASPTGSGFLIDSYENPSFQWESTKTDNIGLNIGLLKNRIQIEADYYIKNTDNLIIDKPLAWYMGSNGTGAVGAPTVNIGSLQNKGWGITLNTTNIERKNFRWASNLNLSHFETKIKSFYSDAALIDRTSWWLNSWTQRSQVGEAPWLFRGYIEEGLFQSEAEINASAVPVDNNKNRLPTQINNGIWVGDVKYRDISGPDGVPDGKITVDDQTNIGNPWPKLYGGFTNNFTYKGFDLSTLITSTYGNDVYNYMARVNTVPNNINLSRNLMLDAMDYAKPMMKEDGTVGLSNPSTDVPRMGGGDVNGNFAKFTDKWVEDGSFIRLKNITLTYSIPSSLISKQKLVRNARVAFGVQNVATITGYKGFDPEVGSYVGRDASARNQAMGLDYGRYPLTRVYTFSVGLDL
jgi:TonB-linked SusC/RagA family outer membrane protein